MLSRRAFNRNLFAMGSLLAMSAAAFAQEQVDTSTLATPAPAKPRPAKKSKASSLATQTEIVAGQNQAPMLTINSVAAMEGAISMYEEIVTGGGWEDLAERSLKKGAKGDAVIALRQRLIRENYLSFDSLSSDSSPDYDQEMVDAVKAFQINHGILPSGMVAEKTLAELNVPADTRLGMLRENLSRVQAYAQDLTGQYAILVNIPATQLETVEDGHVYSRHNIVVGKLERPSPTLASKVSDINFNPYWKIPASIVEKDIVPKYMADPSYLQMMNIRVFDGVEGPEIDPALIDWTTTPPDRYFFRQEPGPHNSLGAVKINFPNKFMVYMHDTPHRELFGRNVRFESSGCVRIDQVQTVVKWILDRTQAPLDETSYQALTTSTEQYEQPIENGPDVRWMYLTAWATDDGRVNFRPDVYGLDGTDFIFGQPQPQTY
ncbi:MAG: L,D-transpeptidase family protein [Alphaproteobacteria bacterium]|uniref:L,D-transpeptidase family protein n=1 Tax=Aestuariivirga sp. TaxID=2650926 RepID=UPI00301921A2|nr:L,D-transpeptidase family protein [Alphaproteobacteria bacterium]